MLFVHLELIIDIPILLWQAGAFFSLKTMDRWQSVFHYHELRRGPLKLWNHGFHIEGLPTLVKDLRQHFHICWCPWTPIVITNQKGFRNRRNIIQRGVYVAGKNKKLKFVSYCRHQLTQYGLRHRPVRVRSNMEHGKEGVVLCKKKIIITCIYRPENNELKLTKLQNIQTISQKPKFHCHGKWKKRKKTACKSRNSAQFSQR